MKDKDVYLVLTKINETLLKAEVPTIEGYLWFDCIDALRKLKELQ